MFLKSVHSVQMYRNLKVKNKHFLGEAEYSRAHDFDDVMADGRDPSQHRQN